MTRIFRAGTPSLVLSLLLSELVLIFLSYFAALYLLPDLGNEVFLLYDSGLQRVGAVAAFVIAAMYFGDLYGDLRVRGKLRLAQRLCMVIGLTFMFQALLGYWNVDWNLPKELIILGSVILFAVLFGWRLLFSVGIDHAVGALRTLFLGSSPTAIQLADYYGRDSQFGLIPIGYILLDAEPAPPDSEVLRPQTAPEMLRMIDEAYPHRIIVAKPARMSPTWVDSFLELQFGGIQAEDAATLYERTFGRVCLAEIRPSQLIFGDDFEPRETSLKLQWVYSFGLAVVLAIPLLPLVLVIALLLKLTSREPVLMREVRVGLHDQPVTLYRFRWTREQNSVVQPTRLGRLLRAWRLDSLPLLYNVLRGDLSIVGPRAVRPEFARALSEMIPIYRHRHRVRPGLTGWAQVSGIDDEGVPEQISELEYDLYYVKNVSASLDLSILTGSLRALLAERSRVDR